MSEVFQLFAEGELTVAETPVIEMNRHFDDVTTMTFDDDLEKNFIADGIELARPLQGGTPHGKKTAHGIFDGSQGRRQNGRHAAIQPAKGTPVIGRGATVGETRADRNI